MESDLSRNELVKMANSAELLDLNTIAFDGDVDMDRLAATLVHKILELEDKQTTKED